MSAEQYVTLSESVIVRELRYRITRSGFQCKRITLVTTLVDDEAKHLEDLPNLRALDIPDAQITDTGMHCIEGMPDLERLDLSDAPITDVGLKHLRGLTNLHILELHATPVTLEG